MWNGQGLLPLEFGGAEDKAHSLEDIRVAGRFEETGLPSHSGLLPAAGTHRGRVVAVVIHLVSCFHFRQRLLDLLYERRSCRSGYVPVKDLGDRLIEDRSLAGCGKCIEVDAGTRDPVAGDRDRKVKRSSNAPVLTQSSAVSGYPVGA